MSITTHTRMATYDEAVREMDRRGEVIKRLEDEIERLRELSRKDGNDHARHVKYLVERHEMRINAYADRIDALQADAINARSRALEEAARIAEDLPKPGENPMAWPDRIAAAIRAKIEMEGA